MNLKKLLSAAASCAVAFGMFSTPMMIPVFAEGESTEEPDTPEEPDAENAVNTNQEGVATLGDGPASITIQGNTGQTLVGKEFAVYQIFSVVNSEGGESVAYTLNPDYKAAVLQTITQVSGKDASSMTDQQVVEYLQSLRDADAPEVPGADADQKLQNPDGAYRSFIQKLQANLTAAGAQGTNVRVRGTTADNAVKIEGLAYGYYMIVENAKTLPPHQAVSMVITTTANPDATMNIKSDYPDITKQVQENSTGEWGYVGDFQIGEFVPFRYLSTVPNMSGYKTYQWIAHDIMDDCLTFNEDTVEITISDDTKTYTLTPDQFTINENKTEEDSYTIGIPDLKAIVDTEFGKGTYGQQIVCTYTATLNDKAVDFIGKPLNNKVRLEYSCNPEEGGEGDTNTTPWHPVDVFTFEMNNVKVNTDNVPLKGAGFRLYKDENCTEEVLVKSLGEGKYAVMDKDTADDALAVEMISDGQGVFQIYGLDAGTYYLKETTTPTGYYPLEAPIKIVITSAYNDAMPPELTQLTATATYLGTDTDLDASIETGIIDQKITNKEGSKLPITGSAMTIMLLAAGAGVVGIGAYAGKHGAKKK